MSHGILKRSSVSFALMGRIVPTGTLLIVNQLSLAFPCSLSKFYQP